ncbi:MAG: hypothetical protein HY922_11940 [Elusimicrobia bacterium]|nr:hypothetical protein [Elusimicrobiota bacterium]
MLRHIVLLSSLLLLPFASYAQTSSSLASSKERISQVLGQVQDVLDSAAPLDALFDGANASRGSGSASSADPDYARLRQIKDVLSNGTSLDGQAIGPFVFNLQGGDRVSAQVAGLEGFVYAEAEIERTRGKQAAIGNLSDYFNYLDALLKPEPWAGEVRGQISALKASNLPASEKYDRLMDMVKGYTSDLQKQVASSDKSAWIKKARIYEIFPRAYNLAGKREAYGARSESPRFFADFKAKDLQQIKSLGFDAVWTMGIFPIGKRNVSGTGGGSPYSIRDHEALNPDLGAEEEFRAFVARAHSAGLRVIIDFVPNHTSMDSKLLLEHPDCFVNIPANQSNPHSPPYGYFDHYDSNSGRWLWIAHGGYESFGQVSPWIDTAQIDYSNPAMRREMSRIVKSWVLRFGVDGFRVDMAYLVLNSNFSRAWRKAMPPGEFLEQMIAGVKSQYPETGFIAEAYDNWDDLSRVGFDMEYGKNNMNRPGGHWGWYDAMQSRDPGWIREALGRAAFLRWQSGGSGMLDFVGNHDEASPQRAFGDWMFGASFLTLMMPGNLLFYGSQEIGFDKPSSNEPKSIPFNVPVQVDWAHPDQQIKSFYEETFAQAKQLKAELGDCDIEALDPVGAGWAGYILIGENGKKAAVVANPTNRTVSVRIDRPEHGVWASRTLQPLGYALIKL